MRDEFLIFSPLKTFPHERSKRNTTTYDLFSTPNQDPTQGFLFDVQKMLLSDHYGGGERTA